MAAIIEIRDVHKSFGRFKALNGVDLSVAEGEVLVVIGRSGSGKSTLIRCLNQLEAHDSGVILIDGLDASRPRDYGASAPKPAWCSRTSTCSRI